MAYQSPLRLMRLTEVLDLTGLSRATLYRHQQALAARESTTV